MVLSLGLRQAASLGHIQVGQGMEEMSRDEEVLRSLHKKGNHG